ncbi:MAG: hypothetical protein KHX56_00090 [Clostridiales bacterium]|nr:hypothetical protein [Clostridiales bacterium]
MVENAASGRSIDKVYDINIYKQIGSADAIAVTNTLKPITLSFNVGQNGSEGREYAVIRLHEGQAELLADEDENSDTVTVSTDKFSKYIVVYNEKNQGAIDESENPTDDETKSPESDTETESLETSENNGNNEETENTHQTSESDQQKK